jgi:hypothetical protein
MLQAVSITTTATDHGGIIYHAPPASNQPRRTPIGHVIEIIMENHTLDNRRPPGRRQMYGPGCPVTRDVGAAGAFRTSTRRPGRANITPAPVPGGTTSLRA